jgi:hypothetical protein
MPKYGPHLKDIQQSVIVQLAALGLQPSYAFDAHKHQERFYTAPCKTVDGNKVIFKMRTEDFAETQIYFRREIRINELFTEFYKQSRILSVPLFLDGDAGHVPEWMVYEFIPGREAGDFYNGFEEGNITGFDVDSLVAGMCNMQEMSALAQGDIGLAREDSKAFQKAYEKYSRRLEPFFPLREIEEAGALLTQGAPLLDARCAIIAHGDFHPGNLILKDGGGVAFIDWYNVQLNNLAFDLAFLVLEITDAAFRDRIFARFIADIVDDEAEFWQLFRFDILRLVPQKINVLADALYRQDPSRDDYKAGLTSKGQAKLEMQLDFFQRALRGNPFIN